MYFLVWCWEWFGDLLFICWCCISCCKLCFVIKWLSPPFHLRMSFALYLRHGCGKRVMYYFRGRIARRDGYYISRDVSHAVMVTIIESRVVRRNRCMDRYVPHGSRTERQRVCITGSDMHHYTWHCITHTYHWWTWYYVLLILWFPFCETCDWWILSLLLRICNLLNCCCWGYVICWSVFIEDM